MAVSDRAPAMTDADPYSLPWPARVSKPMTRMFSGWLAAAAAAAGALLGRAVPRAPATSTVVRLPCRCR